MLCPCETPILDHPLEDEICIESTHASYEFSALPPSPLSSYHLVDLENQPISFPEGPHEIILTSSNLPYDGNYYVSPTHSWIGACCNQSFPLGENFDKFVCANNRVFCLKYIHKQVVAYGLYLMDKSSLHWFRTKHGGGKPYINKMLRWLHWLYDFS